MRQQIPKHMHACVHALRGPCMRCISFPFPYLDEYSSEIGQMGHWIPGKMSKGPCPSLGTISEDLLLRNGTEWSPPSSIARNALWIAGRNGFF